MVRVLDGEGREQRRIPAGGIEGRQLPDEHPERPAIGDDVVHVEDEEVIRRIDPDEEDAKERALGEVEAFGGRGAGVGEGLLFPLPLRQVAQIEPDDRNLPGCGGVDDLTGGPLDQREGRAQGLMPGHERIDAALDDGGVEVSPDSHGCRNVVGARGLELIEEPEALLRKREFRRGIPRDPFDRREVLSGLPAFFDQGGKTGHGRPFEDPVEGHLDLEALAQT